MGLPFSNFDYENETHYTSHPYLEAEVVSIRNRPININSYRTRKSGEVKEAYFLFITNDIIYESFNEPRPWEKIPDEYEIMVGLTKEQALELISRIRDHFDIE